MTDKDYILAAADLPDGDSLFIPVLTKKEQMKLFTRLCKYAEEYTTDIDTTISLAVCKTFQDKKLWIKIIKAAAPSELYVKESSGKVKAVKIV